MITVGIPASLREYAGRQSALTASGASVAAVLEDMVRRHPDLRRLLYTDAGVLRPHVMVFINDQDVRGTAEGLNQPVCEDDQIFVLPSIAGG